MVMSSVYCVVSHQILDTAPLSGFKVHEKMTSHIGAFVKRGKMLLVFMMTE